MSSAAGKQQKPILPSVPGSLISKVSVGAAPLEAPGGGLFLHPVDPVVPGCGSILQSLFRLLGALHLSPVLGHLLRFRSSIQDDLIFRCFTVSAKDPFPNKVTITFRGQDGEDFGGVTISTQPPMIFSLLCWLVWIHFEGKTTAVSCATCFAAERGDQRGGALSAPPQAVTLVLPRLAGHHCSASL